MIFPVSRISTHLRILGGRFLGLGQDPTALAGKGPRIGLLISGVFLVAVGFLIVLFFGPFAVLAIPLLLFGSFNLLNSRKTGLSLSRSNSLSLAGHLTATFVLYLFLTRILLLTYMTDSIVGSYMGVLKVLAFQNPYSYSIKPFLDQFSFPPSFYTPKVDGSFEFHLNYPALNFLTLLPLYAAGLHDLRDGVFVFHLLSVLLIFGLVPSRQKALSLAPFVFFLALVPASWAATIAPYFPGGAAQVPGGIGLSEILLDFGLSPSPLFFVALMGLVGVGSLYLYSTRFSKSRYFVWIFPIVIMFFYYRSFPNYIFYWAFPLAFEFFKNRPAISIWHFSPFQRIPWHPAIGSTIRSVPIRLRVPLVAGLLLTTVFVGAFGAYVSSPPASRVEVRINSAADFDGIGAATQLNVTLDNLTPKPIVPSFFVKWNFLPFLWASNSNQSLAPSTSASYLVTATDGLAAVPRSTSFRLYVYDAATGNLVGQSLSFRIDAPLPTLLNPHFRWWTLDVGAGEKVPFGWKLTKTNIDPLTPAIQDLDQNLTAGIRFRLNYTSSTTNIEKIMLSQKVLLNATTVNLSLFDPLATSTGNQAILGVTVTDGAHEITYLFSNATAKPTFVPSAYIATAIIHIAASACTTASIDPSQAWLAQGWAVPNQVTFMIFLQANRAGLYTASIREVAYPSLTN